MATARAMVRFRVKCRVTVSVRAITRARVSIRRLRFTVRLRCKV